METCILKRGLKIALVFAQKDSCKNEIKYKAEEIREHWLVDLLEVESMGMQKE